MGTRKLDKSVKHAVKRAFQSINNNDKYLKNLAKAHPSVFCSLLAKCIPQEVAVDVSHTVINLNSALELADSRILQLNADRGLIIDQSKSDIITPIEELKDVTP